MNVEKFQRAVRTVCKGLREYAYGKKEVGVICVADDGKMLQDASDRLPHAMCELVIAFLEHHARLVEQEDEDDEANETVSQITRLVESQESKRIYALLEVAHEQYERLLSGD